MNLRAIEHNSKTKTQDFDIKFSDEEGWRILSLDETAMKGDECSYIYHDDWYPVVEFVEHKVSDHKDVKFRRKVEPKVNRT
jgi:hypothetical protein